MDNKTHKRISALTLPFNLINKNDLNNAFDFKFDFKEPTNQDIIGFKYLLNNIESRNSLPIDSPKHHKFISNYLGYNDNNNSSFLKVVSVLPEHYNNDKFPDINFNDDVSDLHICNSEWKIRFNNGTFIILNEFAEIGYFVFILEMEVFTNDILSKLSENDFFRYYASSSDKYKISVRQHSNKVSEIKLNFKQIIEKYFSNLLPFIKFTYEKPIVLHLFGSDSHLDIASEELNNILYRMLRIPPGEAGGNVEPIDFIEKINNKIMIGATHEGAVIIDKFVNSTGIFNKYFPSFIFSLNQREIMIRLNKSISEFHSDQLDSNDDKILLKLEYLKKKVTVYHLKQVFYSISFYDEINYFYNKLIKIFNIELLVKDNNDCISEIHTLIEAKRKKEEEETEKLNSSRLNLILVLLTIAQVWPNLYGLYFKEDFKCKILINTLFYLIILCIGLYFYFIHFPIKSKGKEIIIQNIKEQLLILFTSPKTSHSHS
jgi:hypothetical protein